MPRPRLAVVLGLLFLTRAALVFSCADVFFYGEELAKGTAAKALIDGLPVPWVLRNYGSHEGGGFVVSHLKALAFLVVGESVLAHKIVAFAIAALILAAGWTLCRRHFGERAAWIFGLLFVFCPGPYARFSLLGLGTHFEALLFIALALHLALSIGSPDEPSRAGRFFALGLVAGFGLFFSLLTAPASACAAGWILLRRRDRVGAREVGLALAGLALGALPLVLSVAAIGIAAIRPIQAERARTGIAEALGGLLGSIPAAGIAGCATAIAASVFAVRALRRRPASRIVAAWMVLFLLLYLASGLATESMSWFFYLRLAPFWFGGILLLAAGLGSFAERSKGAARASAVLVALLVAAGLVDLGSLIGDGRPGAPIENAGILARTKGYDYGEYLDKFLHHFETDEAAKVAVVRHFRDDPRLLAPELAGSLFGKPDRDLPRVVDAWRSAWGEGWELGLPGLGLAVDPSYGHELEHGFERIAAEPAELRPGLAEGLARIALGLKYDEAKLREATAVAVPTELRASYLEGIGWRLRRLHRIRPDLARAFLATLPESVRGDVERGWTRAVELGTLP
jgi:hypothetical protein